MPLSNKLQLFKPEAHFSEILLDHEHHGWREIALAHHKICDFLNSLDSLLQGVTTQSLSQSSQSLSDLLSSCI